MSNIQKNFEQKLHSVNIPFNYQEIEHGHHLYRFTYQITKSKKLTVEVIVQESDDKNADGQIIYRQIHNLADRSQEVEALKLINELNGMQTGYYNLYLAGDGEVFLRSLVRVSEDPQPFYETIVMGSAIAKSILPEFNARLNLPSH